MLPFTQSTMWLAILLALCCLTFDSHGTHSPVFGKCCACLLWDLTEQSRHIYSVIDFCCKDLNISVKPGFPKIIKTNDSEVLKAARHSVEKFNNSTNDIFLFKESRVSKALVQVVKGLKYMLNMEIGRTMCRKTAHPPLDNCDFQTNPALKRVLHCYSEVWVIPWLHSFKVPVLRCH